MVSERSIRGYLSTLVKKLGRTSSRNSYQKLATVEGFKKRTEVSKGCVPIYVGEERKIYKVPVAYLSLGMFQELIMNGDFDIKIDGPITLECTAETLDQLLKLAKKQY